MNKIITISREFGSGGRELGKRLADVLGYDYYDKEIISAIASKKGLDENYIEHAFENRAWQSVPLTFHRTFSGFSPMQTAQTNFLIEQKRVIEGIAKAGKNCIIVGRNADVILADENPFNIFVCANMEAKIQRCMERAPEDENLSRKEMERNIQRIDKERMRTREIITGSKWGHCSTYHLTINTSEWQMKELTPAVADFALRWFNRTK